MTLGIRLCPEFGIPQTRRRVIWGYQSRTRRMRILLMAGFYYKKTRLNVLLNTLSILKEPDDRRYFADGVFKGEET
jgi:hypothetical protein